MYLISMLSIRNLKNVLNETWCNQNTNNDISSAQLKLNITNLNCIILILNRIKKLLYLMFLNLPLLYCLSPYYDFLSQCE